MLKHALSALGLAALAIVADAWIGADDRLARRIMSTIPLYDGAADASTVTFDFSRFEEVEPPGTHVLPPALR